MKTRKHTILPLAALAGLALATSTEAATMLTVDNADFAKIPLPLGPGGSSFTYTIDGWETDNPGNPWISHNYYAPDDPTPASEFMVSHSDNIYQALGDTFQSGAIIDFSMIAGVRTSTTDDSWRLFIYDATAGSYATPLAEATGTVAVDGAWHSINLEYTPDSAVNGHTIGIGFGAAGSSGYHYLYYDNAVVSLPGPDTTPPTVLDIVDDKSGGPILDIDTVVYTVTFSEVMNATTVDAGDFENAGSPAATIDSVTATGNPAVFEMTVSPAIGTGTLQLQIKSVADIQDPTGNALLTTPLITDTEVITVSTTPTEFTLGISPNGPDFDFSWFSRADKSYDLLSSTDLSTPSTTWPVDDDGVTIYENIVPVLTGGSSAGWTALSAVPSDDARRFFVLRENDLEGRILRVLSWNIWSADSNYAKINEVIQTTGADVIGFQELGGVASVVSSLETATGQDWHSHGMIISRFPIIGTSGGGALIQITPEQTAWVFNVHLLAYPYQPYDLRDGTLAQNEAAVIAAAESTRGGQADSLVTTITNSGAMAAGIPVFVTGDFNEPSHLDWTQAAADATARPYDLKVEYPASKKMTDLGLTDAFRTVWPDELTRTGYTWTPGTPPPSVGANEVHDRIDFVYYWGAGVTPIGAITVGIDETNPNTDIAITAYPSDHRAVLGTFVLPETSE